MEPFPITPNTGGVLNLRNVVCRDPLIETYWAFLRNKSISLFAERRFGKSSVIRKMNAQPPKGFITMYKSVQHIGTPESFVEILYLYAKEHNMLSRRLLKGLEDIWNTVADLMPEINGTKLGKVDHIWQKKFIYLIDNILQSNPNEILVIFLDEYSLMLNKMTHEDASTTIGFVRDIVHDLFSKRLRFVFTGSIGIDLIIKKIERAGHNLGDPLNHTEKLRLPPFTQEQTNFFCQCLELGCNIRLQPSIRNYLYDITDGIPYFIDTIISNTRYHQEITTEVIDSALFDIINDQDDKNNLEHFYDRINDHYPDPDLSYEILTILCPTNNLTENEIIEKVLQSSEKTKRHVQDEITRLWRDGYFKRTIESEQRRYSFNYSIIRTWWKINKA